MQVMHRFFKHACAVAAAGIALGMLAVPAASASGGGSAAIHPRAIGPAGFVAPRFTSKDHAIGVNVKATSNRVFAGYETAVTKGSSTTVLASFAIPTLTCTTTDRAIAPGAAIGTDNGKSASAAFVFVGCVNGAASYFPGLVVNGREKDYTTTLFAAGDVIDLITKVSTNRTRVQVTDVTTGVTELKIRAGGSARFPSIGDEGWVTSSGALEHVPDFGKLKFRNCTVDGKTLAHWHPEAFQRVNSNGTVQIAIGSLSSTGIAFATRFEHS
jgi:hypothetical protein